MGDSSSIVTLESVVVKYITYEKVSIEILDRLVRRLRNKKVTLVKVLWTIQMELLGK